MSRGINIHDLLLRPPRRERQIQVYFTHSPSPVTSEASSIIEDIPSNIFTQARLFCN
jgi:hypothetical protein